MGINGPLGRSYGERPTKEKKWNKTIYWYNIEVMVGRLRAYRQKLAQEVLLQDCFVKLTQIGVIGATKSSAIKAISDTAECTAKWQRIKCSSTWEKEN